MTSDFGQVKMRACINHPDREAVMYYQNIPLCDDCRMRRLGLMKVEVPEGEQVKLEKWK